MKDFWKVLNERLGFTFVTGAPSAGFVKYINMMDPSLLHFVPAVSNDVAISLASGAFISGIKSCVLIEASNFNLVAEKLERMYETTKAPLVILTNGKVDNLSFKQFSIEKDWTDLDNYVFNNNMSAILIL